MTALLLLALAQAPTDVPVAIVVSSRRDANAQALALADQLKVALAGQGIAATSDAESVERLKKLGGVDPKACDGARLCLEKLAQLLQGVVVGVDVSRAGRLTAGHLEAIAYERVESLAADDLTSDAKSWVAKSGAAASAFAQKLKAPLEAMNQARRAKAAPPPPPANDALKTTPQLDAPREVRVAPEPPPVPPPAVEAPAQKANLGPVPYVTTAAAVIGVGAGIVCLVLGFIDRGTYFQSEASPSPSVPQGYASSFTDAQLQALAFQSNLRISLGAALLVLGAALGVTSGVLFAKE